jgi:hypothetical protein
MARHMHGAGVCTTSSTTTTTTATMVPAADSISAAGRVVLCQQMRPDEVSSRPLWHRQASSEQQWNQMHGFPHSHMHAAQPSRRPGWPSGRGWVRAGPAARSHSRQPDPRISTQQCAASPLSPALPGSLPRLPRPVAGALLADRSIGRPRSPMIWTRWFGAGGGRSALLARARVVRRPIHPRHPFGREAPFPAVRRRNESPAGSGNVVRES